MLTYHLIYQYYCQKFYYFFNWSILFIWIIWSFFFFVSFDHFVHLVLSFHAKAVHSLNPLFILKLTIIGSNIETVENFGWFINKVFFSTFKDYYFVTEKKPQFFFIFILIFYSMFSRKLYTRIQKVPLCFIFYRSNKYFIGEFLTLGFAVSLRGVLRINYHKLW